MSQIAQLDSLPSPVSLSLISLPRKKQYPTCRKCGLIFSKESDLRFHLDKEDWEEYKEENFSGDYNCEECCMFFESRKGFLQHIGKMHKQRNKHAKCRICKKNFKNKYAVRFHVKQVHEKTTRENCPTCGKEFYNKYLIPAHLLKCSLSFMRNRLK